MLETVKDTLGTFACNTSDLAKRVGNGTVDLAHQVGLKRGLIGAAIAAVAVGGAIVLVRYLRAGERRFAEGEEFTEELPRERRRGGDRRTSLAYAR